eukprot:1089760-Pleurochrysis_carterae.AAC.2
MVWNALTVTIPHPVRACAARGRFLSDWPTSHQAAVRADLRICRCFGKGIRQLFEDIEVAGAHPDVHPASVEGVHERLEPDVEGTHLHGRTPARCARRRSVGDASAAGALLSQLRPWHLAQRVELEKIGRSFVSALLRKHTTQYWIPDAELIECIETLRTHAPAEAQATLRTESTRKCPHVPALTSANLSAARAGAAPYCIHAPSTDVRVVVQHPEHGPQLLSVAAEARGRARECPSHGAARARRFEA